MSPRRKEDRNLCADLLEISWTDGQGEGHGELASLEDISRTGLCLGTEDPIPVDTLLTIKYPSGKYQGKVRYCQRDELGYVLGVQFEPGYYWSRKDFRPSHLLQFRLRAVKNTE